MENNNLNNVENLEKDTTQKKKSNCTKKIVIAIICIIIIIGIVIGIVLNKDKLFNTSKNNGNPESTVSDTLNKFEQYLGKTYYSTSTNEQFKISDIQNNIIKFDISFTLNEYHGTLNGIATIKNNKIELVLDDDITGFLTFNNDEIIMYITHSVNQLFVSGETYIYTINRNSIENKNDTPENSSSDAVLNNTESTNKIDNSKVLKGIYKRLGKASESTLEIKNIIGDSLEFSIHAFCYTRPEDIQWCIENGAINIGDLEGVANKIDTNKYEYIENDKNVLDICGGEYKLQMEFNPNGVVNVSVICSEEYPDPHCGGKVYLDGTYTIEKTNNENTLNNTITETSKYIGQWYDETLYEDLRINSIENNEINFDFGILRTVSYSGLIATLNPDTLIAEFNTNNTDEGDYWKGVYGNIKLRDNEIVLEITKSDCEAIYPTTYIFYHYQQ